MRLVVDITTSPSGRLQGVVRTGDDGLEAPFCGTLELVAVLEDLLRQRVAEDRDR